MVRSSSQSSQDAMMEGLCRSIQLFLAAPFSTVIVYYISIEGSMLGNLAEALRHNWLMKVSKDINLRKSVERE